MQTLYTNYIQTIYKQKEKEECLYAQHALAFLKTKKKENKKEDSLNVQDLIKAKRWQHIYNFY